MNFVGWGSTFQKGIYNSFSAHYGQNVQPRHIGKTTTQNQQIHMVHSGKLQTNQIRKWSSRIRQQQRVVGGNERPKSKWGRSRKSAQKNELKFTVPSDGTLLIFVAASRGKLHVRVNQYVVDCRRSKGRYHISTTNFKNITLQIWYHMNLNIESEWCRAWSCDFLSCLQQCLELIKETIHE